MNKKEVLFVASICFFVFLLVYSPHFDYKYPLHVDEWYHISETLKISNGDYIVGNNIFRIGFDLFLLPFSYMSDLVLIYQYFPALWAVLTALILFFIIRKKTDSFYIALFAMLFFASLKSNVNIQGLWFFIPSVFCYPLIYLYVYFFSEGIEKRNKRFVLISLGIMLLTLFVHSVSLLFAIPFLFIYAISNYKYILSEWKFFSLFITIPIIGLLFYSFVRKISLITSFSKIFSEIQFNSGRLPLELNNSFLEIYSFAGFFFAFLGIYFIWKNREIKRYLVYLLWTLLTFSSIIIFKITGISFFAPFQRTFYYFALSLPILSALGLYSILRFKDNYIDGDIKIINKCYWKKLVELLIVVLVIFFIFYSYYEIPSNVKVYHLIDDKDYASLRFLEDYRYGRVMAPLGVSTASYAVSGKNPVGAIYFYGNRTKVIDFFSANNCTIKNKILIGQNVSYVITDNPVECNWTLIYDDANFIYTFRDTNRRKW